MALRIILSNALWLAAMAAILFFGAGDWRWPQAWAYLAENATGAFAISGWLARHDRALLEQRLSSPLRGDQRAQDRMLIGLIAVVYVGWILVMALDHRRLASAAQPLWVQAVGGAAIAACYLLTWRTFRCNSFAVPQVRVQAERQQTVISTGPYRFVRHPMYSGALLLFLGAPLLLGSLWGLAGSLLLTVGLALRALGEERVLLQALTGYADYARRVRFRMIPGLW